MHVAVTAVTGNFFETLGVRAQLGRLIRPDDDQLGGPAIVVLSDHVWRSDFGADPAVLGKTLFFAGGWHRVIGVAPAEFSYPVGTTVWTGATREIQRMFAGGTPDSVGFLLVGRMVPGVTARQAREELEAVLRTYPPANALYPRGGESIYAMPTTGVAEPYADIVLGHDLRPGVIVLFCAVALVLLIACTNVASLLIARGLTRQTELAVRSALGASRTRIAGQLLMEAVVLGIAGGLLSIALATAFVHVAVALAPADLPVIRTAHIDVRVLLFAIAITGASVLAFGLAPALQGARHDTSDALRAGSRSVTRGPIAKLARHALVAAQLALGLVILSGAGLLGRTLVHLQRIDLGFDPKHILFFHIDLLIPSQAIPVEAVLQQWNAARDRIAGRLPASGILGLTTTVAPPFDGHLETVPISVDDQPASRNSPEAHGELAFDDYFKVMRIPLISGRAFTHADDSGAVPVAIVNESFARRMSARTGRHRPPGALGRRPPKGPHVHRDRRVQGHALSGVGGATTAHGVLQPAPEWAIKIPGMPYAPRAIRPARLPRWSDSSKPPIPTWGSRASASGQALLDARLARPRALATLLAALSLAALLLAAIGLFGVLSAYLRERRREIAIRSALGATPAQLRSLVLTQTLAVGVAGLVAGAPLALAGAHLLHLSVRDVVPVNGFTLGAVGAVLLAVVAAAAYAPVARAARVDPRTALAAD